MKHTIDVIEQDRKILFKYAEVGKSELFFERLYAYNEFWGATFAIFRGEEVLVPVSDIEPGGPRNEAFIFDKLPEGFAINNSSISEDLISNRGFQPGDKITLDIQWNGEASFHDFLTENHYLKTAYNMANAKRTPPFERDAAYHKEAAANFHALIKAPIPPILTL